MKHRVIGIDLGTTYSAVASFDTYGNRPEIIPNAFDGGEEATPSVVGLDRATRRAIVGQVAKRGLADDPENTIVEIKREMGELFREDTLEKFRARGIKPVGDPVRARLGGDWYLPQQISALILMKMKEIAEKEIGEEIRDAVITVPAYFTANQKMATEEAALMAGLYPRQLIPEPTAAAICYGFDMPDPMRRRYMVYDLGGGTFDVSIIDVQGNNISVVATSGDPRLGGADFDEEIMKWSAERLRAQYPQRALAPVDLARIRYMAEEAKKRLSTFESTEMVFPWVDPSAKVTILRTDFEQMIDKHLTKSLTFVDKARNAAKEKGVDTLDAILLVGGSTRMPVVRSRLLEHFGEGPEFIRGNLDPDAVVARGAALLAYRFSPSAPPFDIKSRPRENTLVNVDAQEEIGGIQLITEHSLGIGTANERVDKIINQGTNIPVSVTRGGYSNQGTGEYAHMPIYQGEAAVVFENTLIGEMQLGPMTPQPPGTHQFEVTFSLDENGLLSVEVKHLNEHKTYQAKFEHETSVKGEGALATLRNRLVQLYLPAAAGADVAPPTVSYDGPYVPPPPTASVAAPPDQAVTPVAFSPPAAPTPAAVPPAPITPATSARPAASVLEPNVDIPEAFKPLVRRARKQMLRAMTPQLVERFNALVLAMNENRGQEDLILLGDALEDEL